MTVPTRASRVAAGRAIAIEAICGLVIGLLTLPLIPAVRAIGWPRDTAVGIGLFGLMPLLIVACGLADRRLWVNLLGLVLAVLTWALGFVVANRVMGFGSIGFNLLVMAPYVVPGYVGLALAVFVVAIRR